MNGWLVFFAFPISTIILSITAQKLIKSPILVSSVFFAIYLIVAFAVFNAFFIIYAFVYAIFAYITAIMTQMVIRFIQNGKQCKGQCCSGGNILSNTNNNIGCASNSGYINSGCINNGCINSGYKNSNITNSNYICNSNCMYKNGFVRNNGETTNIRVRITPRNNGCCKVNR